MYISEEEDELDAALNVLKDLDIPILSPSPEPQRKVLLLCPIPGCQKKVVRLWNHVFEFHKKEKKYSGKCLLAMCNYLHYCFIFCLVAELSTFYQQFKTGVGTPASPPSTPTLEEDELVPNDLNIFPLSPPQPQRKVLHQCPIPGCPKKVVRLWNHVFQFHLKENKYQTVL